MKFLEDALGKMGKLFEKGKPLEKLYPLYEATETFLLTPGKTTKKAPFIRDAIDLKRVMIIVVVALIPATFMSIYNTGYQILLAKTQPLDFWPCINLGLAKVLPIIFVSYAAGGFWEVLFAVTRKHEINEGFLVTGILFALTLPATIPLWQVAVGISFGVVFGKEIFGGTGYNIFNPALMARAFIFFAYPAQISGAKVWVAVDGLTKATPLAVVTQAGHGGSAIDALAQAGYHFNNLFSGLTPGSIGETSDIACLIGLAILLITRVASWRVVLSCVLGATLMSLTFNFFKGPTTPTIFSLPPLWHFVLGGFSFGVVFMATDPVSACATNLGRWIYGFLIGALTILIRSVNPAYPEGMMLSILFMNVFAAALDYFVMQGHIKKRELRLKSTH